MKKLIYCAIALAAGLFAASCQQENLEPAAQENTVTYTVEVPGVVTKAVADGKNVDRLYYEVYITNGTKKADLSDATLLYKKDIAMVTSQEATSRANVTLNLVQNQNYTVLFWAQCDIENPIYDVTDLRKVTYKEGATVKSNHEDYAAFYAVDYISDATPRDKKVYLKRPFAQLNIGTTINPIDYNKDPYRVVMKKSKVTVKDVPTTFNVATSTVGGDAEFTFEMEEVISDENLVVNNTEYNYAAMNYMFAGDNRTATVEYWLEAEVMTQNNVTVPTNLNKAVVNVPLKENYRTNIVGNLLTSSTEYEVIVDADWAGADLAPDPLYLAAANGGDVTLTKDIVLTAPLEVKAKMTINLNGKTISNPNNYAIENYSELTISGEGNMVGLGGIRSHNGKVIINGGTYTASSDWNAGTYQHILKAVNTEVIINGGIFDATIEGITNAMINVSENSTVTINGGEFRNVMKGEVIPQFAPYMFTYEKNGKLIINDGSFYGGWRFNGETATTDIYGGDFTVSYDGQSFHSNSTHVLTVYGGVFSLENGGKLNPTNHLAAGYKAVSISGSYHVLPEVVADAAEEAGVTAVTVSTADVATALATNNGEATMFMWNDVAYIAKYGEVIITSSADEATTSRGIVEGAAGLTSATVADGIEVVSNRTFRKCANLETVAFPNTLTEIGPAVFQSCSKLANVNIPASVTTIGEGAFAECTSLTSISIPAGVTRIEKDTFRNTGLISIEFHEDVTYFGEYAFRDSEELKEIIINAPEFTVEAGTFLNAAAPYPNYTIKVVNNTMKEYLESKLTNHQKTFITVVAPNTSDANALTEALANGKYVVMTQDIETEAATTAPYGNKYAFKLDGGVLDGNGHELYMECYGDDYGIMTSGGTIKNLTITEGCRAVMIMYPQQDVILDNVNIGGDGVLYPINTGEGGAEGVNLIVTNSVLAGWTSYGLIESATFTNVEFKQGTYYNNIYGRVLKPYVNTTMTNCSFVEHMNLDLSSLTAGHKITMVNCTVNGQDVNAEVLSIPSSDADYDTKLFTVDLPSWATSVNDCIIFN